MMFFQDQENIKKIIDISKAAGHAIMDIYNTNFDVESKEDRSPITKADILSNRIICESLSKLTPDIPILSEESSNINYKERLSWNHFWLVDPLDGTKEFINKNGEFTTNIAFISNNRPVFGLIYVPTLNEIYWGLESEGSYMLKGDSIAERIKIKVSSSEPRLRIVSSRSHPSKDLQKLLEKLGDYELICVGSSLKFCLVARGDADCYPRLGPTCEWDTAAGEIIARSAGANVVNLNNEPLHYNFSEDFLNPYFLVSNNVDTKHKIISLI